MIEKLKQEKLFIILGFVIWVFLVLITMNKSNPSFVWVLGGANASVAPGSVLIWGIVPPAVLMWVILAFFVPVFIWMAKKFPFDGPLFKTITLHVFFSVIFVPVQALIYSTIMAVTYDHFAWTWESFSESIPMIMGGIGYVTPLSYWLIIGAFYLKKYYSRYRKQQLKNSELEAELASIRFHILKVQLHPHFLFNTLHNINSLIYENRETAKNVLNLLKRFLQISINRVNEQQVALEDELEFTGTYLEIEKTRFKNRLSIEKNIGKETLDASVPSFLLQPLVENAIKHGISKKMRKGILKITSEKKDENLIVTVEDNGPGLAETFSTNGVGLKNTKQRLGQLYSNAKFELLSSSLGGLKVHIEIPFESSRRLAG